MLLGVPAVSAFDGSLVSLSPELPQLGPEDALTKIRKAKRNCIFDTSREALKKLKASGVPDSVIVQMLRAR